METLIAHSQKTAQKNGKSFFMNVSWNFIRQPSKGLQNHVVKIVVRKGMEMGRKMEGGGREMGMGKKIEIEMGSEIQIGL